MKKLLIIPLILGTASFTGISDAEAGVNSWKRTGRPGAIEEPRGRCTKKRPCSRMPEIRYPRKRSPRKCNLCQGGQHPIPNSFRR